MRKSRTECYANYQTVGESDWATLEASGAVFFPAAGLRAGSFVVKMQESGYYWSATEYDSDYASYLCFFSDEASFEYYSGNFGLSVRLVRD